MVLEKDSYSDWFIANWKDWDDLDGMYDVIDAMCSAYDDAYSGVNCARVASVIMPPACFYGHIKARIKGTTLDGRVLMGMQYIDTSHVRGTGAMTVPMLRALGCDVCLVGHSEVRERIGMSHTALQAALLEMIAALESAGIMPILCVGERTAEDAENAETTTEDVYMSKQLEGLGTARGLVVAYEPVWAIGSGEPASVAHIQRAAANIHRHLHESVLILYGGSVSKDNFLQVCSAEGINGVLVGSKSRSPQEICDMLGGMFASTMLT